MILEIIEENNNCKIEYKLIKKKKGEIKKMEQIEDTEMLDIIHNNYSKNKKLRVKRNKYKYIVYEGKVSLYDEIITMTLVLYLMFIFFIIFLRCY